MTNIILSAFADEITSDFDEQLRSLKKLGIQKIELRGVDGRSFTALTDEEVYSVKRKLDDSSVTLSALATPLGKIKTDDDTAAHMALLGRIMDIGDILGCKTLRIFSFYPEVGISRDEFGIKAKQLLDKFLDLSEKRGFVLCHENEKDIYGETPEQEKELLDCFNGRLKAVLDAGNFAFCGLDVPYSYEFLRPYIEYFHIKDSTLDGRIVPPGEGKAYIKELISKIKRDYDGKDVILTVEPHLVEFVGLASLANTDNIKHSYSFSSPYEAFEIAVNAIRKMINEEN